MAARASAGRRVVVLLSDGFSNIGQSKREASIEAARNAGVPIIAIGLNSSSGSNTSIDREYLTQIANVSGGAFMDAPTPSSLRQAYIDVASAIRGQYVLTLTVPPSIDRSVATNLTIRVTVGSEIALVERSLPPLAGATPPPFAVEIKGLNQNQRLNSQQVIEVTAPPDVTLSKVQFAIDGNVVHEATAPPFSYSVDGAAIEPGNHLIKVTAFDSRGRTGEKQVAFRAAAPPQPSKPLPILPFIAVVVVAVVGVVIWRLLKFRKPRPRDSYTTMIKPWAGRQMETPEIGEFSKPEEAPVEPVVEINHILGRVLIMDQSFVRGGSLDGLREYEIGTSPLTLGTGASCDIVLEDSGDRVAAEEARLWVQKGRLVYHKLTTLSAMATEGVTSGWQILDSGDHIDVGNYRLSFQAEAPSVAEKPAPATAEPARPLRQIWPENEPTSLTASEEPTL
jgi:hypothetical protein